MNSTNNGAVATGFNVALEEYRRKRKFSQTPEPAPSPASAPASNRFYIQRHSARRLHYDLRLEMEGVLRSWAVPKGPTLDPAEKRLAVLVEDHPLEYGEFEGTIPAGNYGAGEVTLWDRGTYEWLTKKPPAEQWQRGDLKFRLHGHKLMGEFALVRMKPRPHTRDQGNEWLLLKKKDFAAAPGWEAEEHPGSVAAAAPDLATLAGALPAPMPRDASPMLATAARALPEGAEWVYEVKWDGYRTLCFLHDGKVRLRSRRGIALEKKFPELAGLAAHVAAKQAILDGEIVAFDEQGRPSFGALQRRMGFSDAPAPASGIALFAFDLLYLDGYDLRAVTLLERKRLLHGILRPNAVVRYSEHFTGNGRELLEAARRQGLEGIMAKRALSPYEEDRRSHAWLKVKFVQEQDFVICGWTTGERSGLGALVLGLYEGGKLAWVGNVGTGFTEKLAGDLRCTLQPLALATPHFAPLPAELREAHWVKPQLVCSVKFSSWTHEARLRAPVFLRLRPDLAAQDCVREAAADHEARTPSSAERESQPDVSRAALLPPKRNEVVVSFDDDGARSLAPLGISAAGSRSAPPSLTPARRLKFTNLGKVFYPREGYTKRDVINFYAAVAPLLLPHLKDRPLSLKRYPNGIAGDYFFQKNTPESFPAWLRTEAIETEPGKTTRFVLADDEASLLYLANLGCIDQNPWMSRVGSLGCPDFVLLDLDPNVCGFDRIVEAAQLVRRKLERMGLAGYPKTTGGDGMHIYVPLTPHYTYEQARTFAEILARLVAHERPDLFTTPRAVAKREMGKVYFDYLQISEGKTISAPYVLRAHPGAPVATPLAWPEVARGLTPAQFHIANVLDRFARVGDLFAPVLTQPQALEPALAKLEEMVRSAGKGR